MKQIRAIGFCVLAVLGAWPAARAQGPSLFQAFYFGDREFSLAEGRTLTSAAARTAVEKRLAARAAYRSRLSAAPAADLVIEEVNQKRRQLEGFIVALAGRSGVEVEAAAYAKQGVLSYEWEGFADGPISEAESAAKYLVQHSQSAIRTPLEIFMLHRYRCAFEAATVNADLAERDSGSSDPAKVADFRKYSQSLQQRAAEAYVALWSRLQSATDVVVRAVAEDVDAQDHLYLPTDAHPRTFKR